MPMPYTHLAIAQSCLHQLAVADTSNFYLGAVLPDIRYFTKRPRSEYHFSIARLNALTQSLQVPPAFVLGYGVHLLIDELWGTDALRDAYKAQFPAFLRRRLKRKTLEVTLEMFCLACRPVTLQLALQENELTQALGVTAASALTAAVHSLQRYIDQRSLHVGLHIAEDSGLYPPERLAPLRYLCRVLDYQLSGALVHLLIVPPSRAIAAQLVQGVLARVDELRLPA